ncbi:hypothetical protein GT346_31090 [Streptomyces sp. SID161]|nr:hypothetical protein [Streptomyces sp. SID161]
MAAVQRHEPRSGLFLHERADPRQTPVREARVAKVHRSVQHRDADPVVAEQFFLGGETVEHRANFHRIHFSAAG